MAGVTWRGGNGSWSASSRWSTFAPPLATQDVVLPTGTAYTVLLDGTGAAASVFIGAGGTLTLSGELDLTGALSLASSAELDLSGRLVGGTLDVSAGRIAAAGGTLAGVTVLGGLDRLAGATIDVQTARDSASNGTIVLGDLLGLQSGRYDGLTFRRDVANGRGALLSAGVGQSVTLGAGATLAFSAAAGDVDTPPKLGLIGSGTVELDGTLTGDVAGTAFALDTASLTNAGQMQLASLAVDRSGLFQIGHMNGPHGLIVPIQGTLQWTERAAPIVAVRSDRFVNTGTLTLGGGTLEFTGTTLQNSGVIALSDVVGQAPTANSFGDTSLADQTLATEIDVDAATFANSGTISADRIVFSGNVSLATLGTLHGALVFTGTLDLGGGTLDASAYASVSITGTVEHGTLVADGGTLTLDGADLIGVRVLPGAGITDPPSGSNIALNNSTTLLRLSAGQTVDLSVTAGSTLTANVIAIAPGTPGGRVTFGSGFSLSAVVPGSTVEIDGSTATLVNNGVLSVTGATLLIQPTLDGTGTLNIGDGAAVTLDALAATAAPVLDFGLGASLVVLPGTGDLAITLLNLGPGDQLDFASVSSIPSENNPFATGAASVHDGQLLIQGASGDQASLPVRNPGNGLHFHVRPDGQGGSVVIVACFLAGTGIATAAGEVPVESLRPGDRVCLARGGQAQVTWVGHSSLDLARHAAPARVAPVRVRAGAFGPGRPIRDLWLSPEHCVFVDGVLVPVGRLANGATIARDDSVRRVDYWHVELAQHDVLLAAGLPCESYLDTGNRALFAGQPGPRPLHPDLTAAPDPAALAVWAARGAAPLRLHVPDIRADLAARAAGLGWRDTDAPDLALHTARGPVPTSGDRTRLRALLPAGIRAVTLRSNSFVPAEHDAESGDTRRLGVALQAARLAGWPLHPDALARGWHADDGAGWRWSDGDATLALPLLAKPTWLDLSLAPAGRYWRAPSLATTVAPRAA